MSNSKKIKIYQFKISLLDITPKIWRRIQVPENYKFSNLHDAIQDAMGWYDCHLHEFSLVNTKTGLKERIGMLDEDDDFEPKLLDEAKIRISKYFSTENTKAKYDYDFGDNWEHEIILEKILSAEDGTKYPKCIAGKNACPPEDCGGIWGYESMLKIIQNPKHPEYKEQMQWLNGKFDPKEFDMESVIFRHSKVLTE